MAQVKKAKDALCYQIVDLYQFRDFILKLCEDDAIREEVERRLNEIILNNRIAFKSLL